MWNPEGFSYPNTLRGGSRGDTAKEEAFLPVVLDERRRELFSEGQLKSPNTLNSRFILFQDTN